MKVWAVIDLRDAPGPCQTVYLSSSEEGARAWAEENKDEELSYGYLVYEWPAELKDF